MARESNNGSMRALGCCGAWCAGFAAAPQGRGDRRRGMDCCACRSRLSQPSPVDLEAVRGRILFDEAGGSAKLRPDLLEDPRRDLEAVARSVDGPEPVASA